MALRERRWQPAIVAGYIAGALTALQGAYHIAAGIPGIGEHRIFEPTREIIREEARTLIRRGNNKRWDAAVEGKSCAPTRSEEYEQVYRAIDAYPGTFNYGAFHEYMQDIGVGDAYQNLIRPTCGESMLGSRRTVGREPSFSRRLI